MNNGGGWVGQSIFSSLSGDGLLGKTVDFVVGDTESDPESARLSAESMVNNQDVIMLSGGRRAIRPWNTNGSPVTPKSSTWRRCHRSTASPARTATGSRSGRCSTPR
ncbi:hypothetical protein ACFQL1_01015 [Halomicroarcula sp. GCM10025709]|uniref:hypothetical protein n=1 Tax=Halomicroarcula sp. GCM10025709 TaxID=3252669 RepID=UPI00361951D3